MESQPDRRGCANPRQGLRQHRELGANTWRHVAFVEQGQERIEQARESGRKLVSLGMPGIGPKSGGRRGDLPEGDLAGVDTTPPDTPEFRWLMSSEDRKSVV